MTVKLLRDWNGNPVNTLLTLGSATENALTASFTATFNLSGGIAYSPNNPYDFNRTLMYTATVPVSSTSVGTTGMFSFDATSLYVCISTNLWRRADLLSF